MLKKSFTTKMKIALKELEKLISKKLQKKYK